MTQHTSYFGLNESGFSITPDPHYLYLSEQHREALAHLIYGTGDGGGFVLLTGEVGTGKTTVCRAFLEQVPEHVDVALILNPALTARELLQAICEEFGISVTSEWASTRVLVGLLNGYLLEAHANNRRPVLVIDEAQNLSPDVLEQIRLLTNLETHKHKLLQIFLIGQPELRDLLSQQGLRQLAQRITARYHLLPLSRTETTDYIQHRLVVAGADRSLFTPGAIRRIYRISAGVPRLINVLCDRSLLGAYATGRRQVDRGIVDRAARELGAGIPRGGWRGHLWPARIAAGFAVLASIGIGVWVLSGYHRAIEAPDPVSLAVPRAPEPPREPPSAAAPPQMGPEIVDTASPPAVEDEEPALDSLALVSEVSEVSDVSEMPDFSALATDDRTAMIRLLAVWGVEYSAGDTREMCEVAAAGGLACRDARGTWNNLLHYNRPAMVFLASANGETGAAVVTALDGAMVTIDSGEEPAVVPKSALDEYWHGEYRFLWRLPPGGAPLIGSDSSAEAIDWLRGALDRLGIDTGRGLRPAVKEFQASQGLEADGIAGPETLIRLNSISALPGVALIDSGRRESVLSHVD